MNPETLRRTLALVCVICLVCGIASGTKDPSKDRSAKSALTKSTGTPFRQVLNINNFMTWMAANGNGNNPPSQGGDGSAFPRGTRWVIYQDGVVWGAKAYTNAAKTTAAPSQLIRIGGGTYNVGNQAGAIIGTGASAAAESPSGALVRIFRIRRDYLEISDDDVRKDAAEFTEGTVSSVSSSDLANIRSMYALDWNEWPVSKGAPYIERNGVAGYQKPPAFNYDATAGALFTAESLITGKYDEPGLAGADPNSPADQVMWTVCNDLNASATQAFQGSDPMGLETQITVWGYKRADALGQLYFKLIKFINKGGVDIGSGAKGSYWLDSMYVCQWSDPDLGNYSDDLAGCDSTLSLGFVYNGSPIDQEFAQFSLPPPAIGYDFLQGPAVVSAGDSAVFGLKIVKGKKNLPLTSFCYFVGGGSIQDPPFTYEGGLRWWRMLQGYVPDASTATLRLFPHPPGMPLTVYPLSGDPVNRTGFIDGIGTTYSFAPGDRRIVLNSGPFTLAPGDTQEIVVGTVGGLGSDRLSSVSVMKFNDRFVQNTYNALFQVPKAPEPPKVTVGELDGNVVLDWGSELATVKKTETTVNNPGAYVFEGYNVYQFPSATSTLADAKRITTYDLATDPTVILDQQFDSKSGQILSLPVQYGTNSGVKRYFEFNRDYIKDVGKLYNGQEYYLAVTAYSRATQVGFLPTVLESAPQILTVKPKIPFGSIYTTKLGDTLRVTHSTGVSDGVIQPFVINPAASNGYTYEVRFDTTGGSTTWRLRNVTMNTTILSGETNQAGDDNYKMVEGGVFLKVSGPPPGLKTGAWGLGDGTSYNTGSRNMSWANGDGLGFEEFNGAAGWETPAHYFNSLPKAISATSLVGIVIKFTKHAVNGIDSTEGALFDKVDDDSASYAYRFLRAPGTPAVSWFAPWITSTANGSYGFQDYRISCPLTVYNTDVNPPQRLAVGYLENNAASGLVDGYYWPGNQANMPGGQTNTGAAGPREWLFVMKTAYTGSTRNTAYLNASQDATIPVMYWFTWNRRNANAWPGDQSVTFTPNRPNTVNDVFTYTVPAPSKGTDQEKVSIERVNVYPNPYYAFNAAETNRLVRFVTFSNLPPKVKVRIFNLAGQPVRVLEKDDVSQFLRWDLNNQDNFPVASGMYLAYLELTLPTDGSVVSKVLKLAIIQEQEILNVY